MPKPLRNKPVLMREITLTLVFKFMLIYFIWLWFFSSPVDERLDNSQVQNAIFGTQPAVLKPSATDRNPVEEN